MRLIDHLKALGHSNRQAQDMMQTGKVFVSGVPTADAVREVDPAQVEVRPNAPRIRPGRDPVLLWRDDHLAVVWKPPGLLSVPAPHRRQEDNLLSRMGRVLGSLYPVHRLDEPTSGLMMIARTAPMQQAIKDLLEVHAIERRYAAIVRGRVPEAPFTVQNRLVRDRGDGLRGPGEGPDAREAITHLRRLERLGDDHALVEARLETGRTHQVRIHLSGAGFPVLGEPLYASPVVARAAPRLALHAWHLALEHPHTHAPLRFDIPLADDLEALRRSLLAAPSSPPARRPRRR